MEAISVVHLARAKNGLKPFESFLQSYQKYRAGISHNLIIVYKGFRREDVTRWEQAAGYLQHQSLFVADWGFDLRAFRRAAEKFTCRYLFFLNSFSEILAEDWLVKTYALAQGEETGIAGSTGSWESMRSNALADFDKQSTFVARLRGLLRSKICQLCFDPFPNYHIRTNAFMISRDRMLSLWPRYVLTKREAYLFENGKNGLTKQILRLGLQPLVVGRDGKGYEPKNWNRSNTFRQADQQNLFVADNQTRIYQNGDSQTRQRLAMCAWGQKP